MIPSEEAVPRSLVGNDLGRGPREIPSDIVRMAGNTAPDRTDISSGVTLVKGGMNKEAFNKLSSDATQGFKSGSIAKYNQQGMKDWEASKPAARNVVKIDTSK